MIKFIWHKLYCDWAKRRNFSVGSKRLRAFWLPLLLLIVLACVLFFPAAGSAWRAATPLELYPSQAPADPICAGFVTGALPFVDIIPSLDGEELVVEIYGAAAVGQPVDITVSTQTIDGGGTSNNVSWTPIAPTPVYSKTLTGLPPAPILTGLITVTVGSQQQTTDFVRYFVPMGSTATTIYFPASNPDTVFELQLLNADTFPADTYVVAMHSRTPPVAAPDGACFVGELYNIRAANAKPTADRPMNLVLHYPFVGAVDLDPQKLKLVAWNRTTDAAAWVAVPNTTVDEETETISAAITAFTTYALLTTTAAVEVTSWHDEFADLSGINTTAGAFTNIFLGSSKGDKGLLLANPTQPGYALSIPISLTHPNATWSTLTYRSNENPPTTTLSVDVLGLDQQVLLAAAPNNSSLAALSAAHPVLLLRVKLISTAPNQSPALLAWGVNWQLPTATPTLTPTITVTSVPVATMTITPTVTPTVTPEPTKIPNPAVEQIYMPLIQR